MTASTPRILVFAGSNRKDSLNRKLARAASTRVQELGAHATLLELADYPLPLFDGDLEAQGHPDTLLKLKKVFAEHDALLIASPEHNSTYSALLKNVVDWLSRQSTPDEVSLSPFNGKIIGLVSASPGVLGGLRGLVPLRMLFGNINTTVIPQQFALGNAHLAFAEDGSLKDDKNKAQLDGTLKALIHTAAALKA